MSKRVPFDLYLITDRKGTGGRSLLTVVKMALDAGVRAVQLRECDLPTRELVALAERVKGLTDRAGARLFINGRMDVCLTVDADGVHLKADHLPISVVRRFLGSKRLIGVSCHSVQEVMEAEKEGADFVALGPIYETPSKASYGRPVGKDILKSARVCCAIPVFAIGGIRVGRVQEVMESGAAGVAMISSILNVQDVGGAVHQVLDILQPKGNPQVLTIDRLEAR